MEPNIQTPPVTQPTQNIQSTPSKSSNKKWIAIILLLLIMLIIFTGGAYIYGKSQTSNLDKTAKINETTQVSPTTITSPSEVAVQADTSKWKMFTNTKYGYSFEYPSNGEIINESKYNDTYVQFIKYGPTQRENTEVYDAINLSFYTDILDNKSLDELVNSEIQQSKDNQTAEILESPKPITIAGIKGISYTVQGLGKFKYIYLPMENNTYMRITDGTSDPTGLEFQKISDQIISSLKFK